MKSPTIKYIENAQKEYLDLLMQYKENFQDDVLSIIEICTLIDDVKCFWLERLEVIEYELDELTEAKSCFVLSGAIFLNVSGYEHFYFKTCGDCHLLPDPMSKMALFFRIPEEKINRQYTTSYFKRAFFDTLEILTTYKGYFYILPIHELAVDNSERHRELLNGFFWRFISSIFNYDFKNNDEFCEKYKSFEEIDADLSDFVRKHLVFNDISDSKLSLRERLEKYSNEQTNISSYLADISDSQRFLISVSSYISQISDILDRARVFL